MWESTQRSSLFIQDRNKAEIHSQRRMRVSWMRSTVKTWFKSVIQDSPSGSLFTFGQLYNFFFHIRPVLGATPSHMGNFLLRWIPPQRHVHMYWVTNPLPFWLPRNLLTQVHKGKFSLISGVVVLSLYFSRAQLLSLALSSECLDENKASIFLHWTDASSLDQGPIRLLHQPW